MSPVLLLADGSLAVGVGRELRRLDWASTDFGALPPAVWPAAVLARVEPSKPGNRFNDGNVDALGRLWIGERIIVSPARVKSKSSQTT